MPVWQSFYHHYILDELERCSGVSKAPVSGWVPTLAYFDLQSSSQIKTSSILMSHHLMGLTPNLCFQMQFLSWADSIVLNISTWMSFRNPKFKYLRLSWWWCCSQKQPRWHPSFCHRKHCSPGHEMPLEHHLRCPSLLPAVQSSSHISSSLSVSFPRVLSGWF